MKIVIALAALLLAPLALAQSITDPSSWPAFWGDAAALSGLVLLAVEVIKARAPKVVNGMGGLLVSIAVGLALAPAGIALGYYDGTMLDALTLGFMASIVASGGYDLVIRRVLAWLRGGAASTPT